MIGGISKEAMKVPREGEYLTPNLLKVITPGASVGEKFDVRKKPEIFGGSVDTDPNTLTGAEKLFGRVVR